MTPTELANIPTTYNLSSPDFQTVCNLNQIELLNQLQKLPTKLFWFMLAATILLIIYNWILPAIKWKYREAIDAGILQLALTFMVMATVLTASLVFTITSKTWNIIVYALLGIVIILIGVRIYLWKKGAKWE